MITQKKKKIKSKVLKGAKAQHILFFKKSITVGHQ